MLAVSSGNRRRGEPPVARTNYNGAYWQHHQCQRQRKAMGMGLTNAWV
jgi:hypothetical protein